MFVFNFVQNSFVMVYRSKISVIRFKFHVLYMYLTKQTEEWFVLAWSVVLNPPVVCINCILPL